MDTLGTCPGPHLPDFFLFEGPPTGCGEIIILKINYLITFAEIN